MVHTGKLLLTRKYDMKTNIFIKVIFMCIKFYNGKILMI